MNDSRLKNITPQWMICFDCKSIITIVGFIITKSSELLVKYSCQCPVKVKEKQLHKYLYGLNLLQGLGFCNVNCPCEQGFPSYYCITCAEVLCFDCYQIHKRHLLSRYLLKYHQPLCQEHNYILSYMCLKCSIGICEKCFSHRKHNYIEVRDYYSILERKMLNKYNMKENQLIKEMLKGKKIILSKENEDDLIKVYTILCDQLRKSIHFPNLSILLSLKNFINITQRERPKVKFNKIPVLKGPLTVTAFVARFLSKHNPNIIIKQEGFPPIDQIFSLGNGKFVIHFRSFIPNRNNHQGEEPLDDDMLTFVYGTFYRVAVVYENFFLKVVTVKYTCPIIELEKKGQFLFLNYDIRGNYYEVIDCTTNPVKTIKKFTTQCRFVKYMNDKYLAGLYDGTPFVSDYINSERIEAGDYPMLDMLHFENDNILCMFQFLVTIYNLKTKEWTYFIESRYSFKQCFLTNKYVFFFCEDYFRREDFCDIIVERKDNTKSKNRRRDYLPRGVAPGNEPYVFYISQCPHIITIDTSTGEEILYHIDLDFHQFDPKHTMVICPLEHGYYLHVRGFEIGLYILE